MKDKEYYMELAIKEAKKATLEDEVPVGCVIVKDGEVIAKTHNKTIKNNNCYSHAELLAIQKALKKLDQTYLNDCELYVTLEPCIMCAGMISNARINKLYFGAYDEKGGSIESKINIKEIKHIGAYPREVNGGLCKDKCANILSTFFRGKR